MNILFVSPCYKPYLGGTERIVEQLSAEFLHLGAGNRVGVLTTKIDFQNEPARENPDLPSEEVLDGVEVFRLSFSPRKLRFFHHLPAGLFSWEARRVVRTFQPDVVHFVLCEWFVANGWIYLLTRKRSRHVFTLPFHEPPEGPRSWLMRYANVLLGRLVDSVQVHSSFIKQRAGEYYRVPQEKMRVIPPGFSTRGRRRESTKRPRGDCVTFLAVGRLSQDKGQLELVQIFHRALPGLKKKARLVMAGGDGGHREAIERYARENQIEDLVEVKGYVSDDALHALYREADAFILLTRVESFGIVFAEAQSYGLPIIAYGIGPLASAFTRGALLAEPFDPAGIEEAIRRIVNDEALLARLSEEAEEYAWENFSWEKMARSLMSVYNEITQGTACNWPGNGRRRARRPSPV